MNTFVKFTAKENTVLWILEKRPTALLLLTLAASRAKLFEDHPDKTLEIGEAFIGDYKKYGVTEQVYRGDKKFLETNGLVTTRATNRGTIIKIVSSEFFDFTKDESNGQRFQKPTVHQRLTRKKETRIKENIKEKSSKNQVALTFEFGEIVNFMASTLENISADYKASPSLLKNFGEVRVNHSMEEIKMAITKASQDQFWGKHCFPHVLFRTKGKEGMEVDNILTLLNLDSGPQPQKMQKNDVNNYL